MTETKQERSAETYGESYYMDGINAKLSNYESYTYRPDATISMAAHLRRYLDIKDGERVLDVGCARGFYVHALRLLGVDAFGYDISEWAIQNCHPEVSRFVSNYLDGVKVGGFFDVVYSKDCFEHIPPLELSALLGRLLPSTRRMLFVIVPLASSDGGAYVHPKEENDATHINRWTLTGWLRFFQQNAPSFIVSGSYRYPGLKPGSYEVEEGYGFFKLTHQ